VSSKFNATRILTHGKESEYPQDTKRRKDIAVRNGNQTQALYAITSVSELLANQPTARFKVYLQNAKVTKSKT